MQKAFVAVVGSLTLILFWSVCGLGQAVPGMGSSVSKGSSRLSSYEYFMVDGQRVYPYRAGSGLTPPRLTHQSKPKYSKEARKAKLQGKCVVWLIVGADGVPHDLKVTRALGMGLDEQAIIAIEKWKFEPGQKDGHPVAVTMNVEVNFKLR